MWILDLRGTDNPFLHLSGTKMTKYFWAKNFKKCRCLRIEIFSNFKWNWGLPGGLPDVYFMIPEENLDFTTAGPAIFPYFQIRSKMTKIAEKPQKWHFLADLSVLPRNFSAKLRFHWFSSHSDQKKSIFGSFQYFQDFAVVKWPNSKSGHFCPDLTQKIWSNGLSII